MGKEENTWKGIATDKKALIKHCKARYTVMQSADDDNRRLAQEDMEFTYVPGNQWESNQLKERGQRPCYEFNKTRITIKRISNSMRESRMSGKIIAAEDGDVATAEIFDGLIRNIWSLSDGNTVVDGAATFQVCGGMAAWRIETDYATDSAFEQDIKITSIPNPFCLFPDPSCRDPLKRDGHDWMLTERIPNYEYEARWPNADKVKWEPNEWDDNDEWDAEEEETRIAEYWWKEPTTKELWQLQDGKAIYSDSKEASGIRDADIVRKREVKTHKIMTAILSGDAVLEGPTEWAGTMFPFIMVFGEHLIVDGKTYWYGVTRWAKDAQRAYNISRTSAIETVFQAPQSKFWATVTQAGGNAAKWAEAHLKLFPFLIYTADPKAPGPPKRMGGADIPVALHQEAIASGEDLKGVTGIFNDDVGAPGDAHSGRAILAKQAQGQLATFDYPDNMNKGIKWTWELLVDLIPKIYDSERELRIIGEDGTENYVKVNSFVLNEFGEKVKVNDLSVGKYDVVASTGPNWSTKRQEAAETYQALAQGFPQIYAVAGDLIMKSMDLPYAEQIAERMKKLLPPELQEQDEQGGQAQIPPEVQQMMMQAQQAMQQVEQQMVEAQKATNEAEVDKSQAEKLLANLQAEEAKFKADIAQQFAALAKKESELIIKQANDQKETQLNEGEGAIEMARQMFNVELSEDMTKATDNIQQMAGQMNQRACQAMEEIEELQRCKPRVKEIRSERVDGQLIAVPVYEEVQREDPDTAVIKTIDKEV